MISHDEYKRLKAANDSFEAARKGFDPKRYQRGGGYDAKDYDAIAKAAGLSKVPTNEDRSKIELYEFVNQPPEKYFAYYDKALTKVSNWMGVKLGDIISKGAPYEVGFRMVTGRRGRAVSVRIRGINGVTYSGKCFLDAGDYCRMTALKGQIRKNPSVRRNIFTFNNPPSGPADPSAVRELQLYIENDGDLYRQQFIPIVKNLMLKRRRGVYDREKAVKLFMYLMESGAKKYIKEFVQSSTPGSIAPKIDSQFNKNTRLEAARNFRDSFETEAEYGNYDRLIGPVSNPRGYRKMGSYEVIVGNIGMVYSGNSHETAEKTFSEYVRQSKSGRGRAGGESVTLMLEGEIMREHFGTAENPRGVRKNIFAFNNPKRPLNAIEQAAADAGLLVTTWAPGDGMTRYRFFKKTGSERYADYHQGDGLYTALGRKDAAAFISAFGKGRSSRTNPYIRDSKGEIVQSSRNLRGIREYVGKHVVKSVSISKHQGSMGMHRDALLQVDFTDGKHFSTQFADWSILKNFVRQWRNVYGAPLIVNGVRSGKVDYHNSALRDTQTNPKSSSAGQMYVIEGFTPFGRRGHTPPRRGEFRTSSLEEARARAEQIFQETGVVVAITKQNPLTRRESARAARAARKYIDIGRRAKKHGFREASERALGTADGFSQSIGIFGKKEKSAVAVAHKLLNKAAQISLGLKTNPVCPNPCHLKHRHVFRNPLLQTVFAANPPVSDQWDRMTGRQRLMLLEFVGFDETAGRYVRLPWKMLSDMVKQALEQYWRDSSARGTTRRRPMPVGANPLTRRESASVLRRARYDLRLGSSFRPGHTRSERGGQAHARAQVVRQHGAKSAGRAAMKIADKAQKMVGTTISNPGGLRLPKPGTKMTVSEAFELARRIGDRALIEQCRKALKLQKVANKNAKCVIWKTFAMGSPNKIDSVVALTHYGDSPETMYRAPKGSKKGQHMYRHRWGEKGGKTSVPLLASADGKMLLMPLEGKKVAGDWLRH